MLSGKVVAQTSETLQLDSNSLSRVSADGTTQTEVGVDSQGLHGFGMRKVFGISLLRGTSLGGKNDLG